MKASAPAISGSGAGRETLFSEIRKQSRKDEAPTFRAIRNKRYRLTLETNSQTPCELFDLQEDPLELNDRVSDPSLAIELAAARTRTMCQRRG